MVSNPLQNTSSIMYMYLNRVGHLWLNMLTNQVLRQLHFSCFLLELQLYLMTLVFPIGFNESLLDVTSDLYNETKRSVASGVSIFIELLVLSQFVTEKNASDASENYVTFYLAVMKIYSCY